MIPSNSSGASAAPLQSDVENSNGSELGSGQNDSIKTPDDAENAERGSQTSEDIGNNNSVCNFHFMHIFFLFYNSHTSIENFQFWSLF